jgi:hypothetical protein
MLQSEVHVESQRNVCSLLIYYVVLIGNLLPKFRKSLMPPSSGSPRRLLRLQWRWMRHNPERCGLHQESSDKPQITYRIFMWTLLSLSNILFLGRAPVSLVHVVRWLFADCITFLQCFVLFCNLLHETAVFLKNENTGSGFICEDLGYQPYLSLCGMIYFFFIHGNIWY